MKKVVIESPYKPIFKPCTIPIIGKIIDLIKYNYLLASNLRYARACMLDAITNHNEAPFMSHLLYTQILDDRIAAQRELGITAGLSWYSCAYAVIFYVDYGMSEGMITAEKLANSMGLKKEYRQLIGWK